MEDGMTSGYVKESVTPCIGNRSPPRSDDAPGSTNPAKKLSTLPIVRNSVIS